MRDSLDTATINTQLFPPQIKQTITRGSFTTAHHCGGFLLGPTGRPSRGASFHPLLPCAVVMSSVRTSGALGKQSGGECEERIPSGNTDSSQG